MSIQELTDYFIQYGAFFIYLIVLLEYLNLPGFPAGVIMPLAGIWAARGEISFPAVMVLTVAAGLTGSWALYLLGRYGGGKAMAFYLKKFPKHRSVIEGKMHFLKEKGCAGVFISKLLPMVRTLISIPAGMVQMNFAKYTISSVCGIFLWNLAFVGGVPISVERQSEELIKLGHEVTVFAPAYGDTQEEREKNYGFLLRGIADIRERAGDDFHVLILGDGSQKSELKVRASLLGIQDMVTFLGNIPNREVKDYLRAADLFLFASTSETQGIVLAESFAAGTPVVAVRAVGTEDIIENGVNGFLTDESEKEWVDRAAEYLKRANLAVMKQAARAAAENYRASKLAIYEEMLYNQCICEKREKQKRAVIHGLGQSGKGEVLYESEERGAEHSAMAVH